MKIIIYELLGMVKDGKAPKKVKWRDKIWTYNNYDQDYEINDTDLLGYGFCNHRTLDFLNDEVEILEEEKKIPEKLENEKEFYAYTRYEENKNEIDKVLYILKAINLAEEKIDNLNNSINSIIDYLKSKGDK